MTHVNQREWLGVWTAVICLLFVLLVSAVLLSRASRRVVLIRQLTTQLDDVAVLEGRVAQAGSTAAGLRAIAVKAGAPVPRARVSEVLMGESFELVPGSEVVAGGWEHQMLQLSSKGLPASKLLALLPVLCGDDYRYRVGALDVRALPGRRGLVSFDIRFERLVVLAE